MRSGSMEVVEAVCEVSRAGGRSDFRTHSRRAERNVEGRDTPDRDHHPRIDISGKAETLSAHLIRSVSDYIVFGLKLTF
jgi:hypothetical protein